MRAVYLEITPPSAELKQPPERVIRLRADRRPSGLEPFALSIRPGF